MNRLTFCSLVGAGIGLVVALLISIICGLIGPSATDLLVTNDLPIAVKLSREYGSTLGSIKPGGHLLLRSFLTDYSWPDVLVADEHGNNLTRIAAGEYENSFQYMGSLTIVHLTAQQVPRINSGVPPRKAGT